MTSRYDAGGNPEAQFEPGSKDLVLRNLLGIVDPAEMDDIELRLLTRVQNELPNELQADQTLRVADLCDWHHRWLGGIYPWAGKYRSVNMSKNGFAFAAARFVPQLLNAFDCQILAKHTPCAEMNLERLVEAIAVVHVELILIHPFREGNGRLARLLANIMALQAGIRELDYSLWDANRESYFEAIHAGMTDYAPMKHLVRRAIETSTLSDTS